MQISVVRKKPQKHSCYVVCYNENYACQSVKLGYETLMCALRYLYENSFKDFVSSSDLCLFSATLQNVAYTCLYSPSPSWALNCLADL